jgi:hypothetical protein
MKKEMTAIKTEEIRCEFDRNTTEEEIKGRAQSIQNVGLIHAVKIQPIKHKKFNFEVVAGRKSFMALTTILNKTELSIPEEVSFITGDAELIAFAENDERTDLTLAEQVEKLTSLSDRYGIVELASQTSHSAKWVASRIRLKQLSKSWNQAMHKNEFTSFTVGHYEVIAKYSLEMQENIYEYCTGWNFNSDVSIAQFTKELEENFNFLLKNAPWNSENDYQGCGECLACIERKNGGFLFDDMNDYENAVCQNRQYYFEKLNEFVAGKVEEAKKENPEIILVSQEHGVPENFPIDKEEFYQSYMWEKSTKKAKGEKALVVNGPMVGKIIYVEISEHYKNNSENDAEQTEEKTPSTLAERKERKNKQRQRYAINSLMEFIESFDYETPDRDTLFRLIACLGVDAINSYSYQAPESCYDMEEHDLNAYSAVSKLKGLDNAVWRKVAVNIVQNLKQGQSGTVDAKWNEAETVSGILSFDLKKAFAEAVEALPNPKAWVKLEEKEVESAKAA